MTISFYDVSGMTFGRLTVLGRSARPKDKHGHALWDVRCVCGNEKMVQGRSLMRGDTQSCGCLQRERAREDVQRRRARGETVGTPLIDITGQVFDRLTVIRISEHRNTARRRLLWECQCTCGTTKLVSGSDLRKGYTRSCGCLNRENLIRLNKSRRARQQGGCNEML